MRKAIPGKPGKSVFARCLFLTSIMVAASAGVAAAQELKHYDSTGKNFWQNPPPDWFLGDETLRDPLIFYFLMPLNDLFDDIDHQMSTYRLLQPSESCRAPQP